MFADSSTRRRDFLWREAAQGTFYILSARRPVDDHKLFRLDEPKLFAPALAEGDRLRFSLRANTRLYAGGIRADARPKHDVVFDALRHHPSDERKARRLEVVRESGFAWLAAQGQLAGFSVEEGDIITIDGYQPHQVSREGKAPMRFSTLDIEGVLHVRDPSVFLDAVLRGFGSAKAYGCGLMLIRRA